MSLISSLFLKIHFNSNVIDYIWFYVFNGFGKPL